MSLWRRWRDDDDDDDDEPPQREWPRYLAELAPQASNDLLAMGESHTKAAIIRLFEGDDPNDIIKELAVGIEDLPDPYGGWSFLRVDRCLISYRRLTIEQFRIIGRSADILVSRIVPFRE